MSRGQFIAERNAVLKGLPKPRKSEPVKGRIPTWLDQYSKTPRRDTSDWRLRKVLRALAAGGRIVLEFGKHIKMLCLKATGRKRRVKPGLFGELVNCHFVQTAPGGGYILSNWGRYAAEAALR